MSTRTWDCCALATYYGFGMGLGGRDLMEDVGFTMKVP